MCACISLRADWARLAVRAERCGEEVHLVCEPAQRVLREYPASTDYRSLRRSRARLFISTEAVYRSLYAQTRAIRA
jgi:hypothetical protein